jgi:hypothetical protein
MWGVFWFLFGCALTLYFILLMRKRNKVISAEKESKSIVKFYMNLFILNKEEAVQNIIKQKVANKYVAGVVGALASNILSDDKIAERIGSKISELVPIKLAEFGVKSVVEMAYQRGAFLCIKVDILTADARKVIEKKGGKAQLEKFNFFMDLVGIPQLNETIDDSLATVIGEKMQSNLPKALKERMQEKAGMDVKVICCSEAEQSEFLLGTLKELAIQDKK